MAYNIKYRSIAATKSDSLSYINIYEEDYVGDIIEYPCVSLEMQYIPKSDDTFEPIYVSEINVILDITDNLANIPDFTTLNDRKYFVRILKDNVDVEWQGWILSDNVQLSFSTGRKELAFNAIDGIGMLEKIPYGLPNNYTLVATNTLIGFLANALTSLGYPFDYNIISGISFFAEGMGNRLDAAINDPLNQTYSNYASYTNDNQEASDNLNVITQVAKGFGARFFQANGNFYIVPLTELAQASYYSTIYNSSGVAIGAATQTLVSNIEGFTNNTSGLYFVDNSQFKIIRKGYNKIKLSKTIDYPKNYVTNWDLKNYEHISPTEDDAFGWTETRNSGYIYIKENPTLKFNAFIMGVGPLTPYYCLVSPNDMPKIAQNEVINISFNVNGINTPASGPDALFLLKVELTNGVDTYYLNKDKKWIINGAPYEYYYEPFSGSNPKANVSLELAPAPTTGDLSMEFILNEGTTYWKFTVNAVIVENFKLEVVPSFASFTTESSITDTEEYVYEVDLPFGFNDITDGYFSYRGFLSDSTGLNLKNWYRQEYPDQIYRSLSELVVKQYSNCLNKNIINLDASFMGMQTESGRFSAAMRITASDTDPSQISVENKTYVLGNTTIDLPNNVIQATLLDINSGNIDTNLITIYDTINLTGNLATGYGHFRSTGFLTREAAYAAPLTEIMIYLENAGFPSIGDVYYVDATLGTPFNGAQLWWKVMTSEVSFSAFKISSSGGIMEIYL